MSEELVVENANDSIYLEPAPWGGRIVLRIGPKLQGMSRNSWLTPSEVRLVAYALLAAAERLDVYAEKNAAALKRAEEVREAAAKLAEVGQ